MTGSNSQFDIESDCVLVEQPLLNAPQDNNNNGGDLYLKEAKKAYKLLNQAWSENNADLSREAHDKLRHLLSSNSSGELKSFKDPCGKYVKSIVFGGLDGIITIFSMVAAVAGGGLAAGVVVIMGISNLLGDGLSMGLGDYLSSKAQLDYIKEQFEKEKWETENYLQGEIEEMVACIMKV
eukprot:TRINITY_DN18524_c1_g1_i2.p1 TRINITY_DN18524_c1_g1~~TRINITY_DN18524_c1_g1_i2.p1  ORF type:complete len:205 (-),score=28.93 TRINITY_DN18524_c1_g1_i2:72-611(-)